MTELSLEISRKINASPDVVYKAWLDPELLAKFMVPGEGVTVTKAETDPVEGGRFEIVMNTGDTELPHGGVYQKLTPHTQIIFSWESPFSSDDSTVTLDFQPVNGGTEVRLRHIKFADETSRDNHKSGWGNILSALDNMLPAV